MPRLIAAVYADRGNADRALQALIAGGVARDRIDLAGGDRHPSSELAPGREVPQPAGLVAASADERIAELAAFLDPIAFANSGDLSLRKRRRAALREAANRVATRG